MVSDQVLGPIEDLRVVMEPLVKLRQVLFGWEAFWLHAQRVEEVFKSCAQKQTLQLYLVASVFGRFGGPTCRGQLLYPTIFAPLDLDRCGNLG